MTPFYRQLVERIADLGGIHNAHLHMDRVGTIADAAWQGTVVDVSEISGVSLTAKRSMVSTLHSGKAYGREDLRRRVNECLDEMISVNTRRADTVVDVTPDNVRLSAIQTMHEIKTERENEIDLRLGTYSPLGYLDSERERWDLLVEGAKYADFIGSLPEADDCAEHPGHIGFREHLRRMLLLGQELNKELHIHLDQRNESSEKGTEQLVEVIREVGAPASGSGEPMVWAIHVISPSTYDDARFNRLLEEMVEHNIGVICCPSAAIGMRQLRPLKTPTFNSIARILEMLAVGLTVRLGNDNIADICSPSTTANLIDEIFILSAALRFYHIPTLARVAAGQKLSDSERNYVIGHLKQDKLEIERMIEKLRS